MDYVPLSQRSGRRRNREADHPRLRRHGRVLRAVRRGLNCYELSNPVQRRACPRHARRRAGVQRGGGDELFRIPEGSIVTVCGWCRRDSSMVVALKALRLFNFAWDMYPVLGRSSIRKTNKRARKRRKERVKLLRYNIEGASNQSNPARRSRFVWLHFEKPATGADRKSCVKAMNGDAKTVPVIQWDCMVGQQVSTSGGESAGERAKGSPSRPGVLPRHARQAASKVVRKAGKDRAGVGFIGCAGLHLQRPPRPGRTRSSKLYGTCATSSKCGV